MVAREEPHTADIELLGRLVTALSMGARGGDDHIARLRFACAKLQEIRVEEFPWELQNSWERVLKDLQQHGPTFDRLPEHRAGQLMGLIAFVVKRVEMLAGL